jgi:type IV pilus assembly protein PilY1
MKQTLKRIFLALAVTVAVAPTQATDLARTALAVHGAVAPNVIFGMDDSISMDWEVLLPTHGGLLWWNNQKGWENGVFNVNNAGSSYAYLFPVGCSTCGWKFLPPTPQFASLRSSSYNPLYYNPQTTYKPWAPATVNGIQKEFFNSVGSSALLHPLSTETIDLTQPQARKEMHWTFDASTGMQLPVNTQYKTGGIWHTVDSLTISNNSHDEVSVPYFPASYWNKESCTPDTVTCVQAPDSATLKLYEVKSGNNFPSGRTYEAELQNFANWFTYYRSRKLMLAGSMGHVLNGLSGMRVGLIEFNTRSEQNITMYNTDSADNMVNARVVAGKFYDNRASGSTPTLKTLKDIGEAFNTDRSIITAACQRNAAFIVTDGFANDVSGVDAPDYDRSTYGGSDPYQVTTSGTLADIALAYYTLQLRPDLPAGLSPAAVEDASPAADKNKNLHMNTYGITLGAKGEQWPDKITDPYGPPAKSIDWPVETETNNKRESIDDLWHATINGRGGMFLATNPAETAANMQAALTEIQRQSGSQGAVTFSTVNLKPGDSTAFVGSYSANGYSGELLAFPVDPATGNFAEAPTWSAGKLLLTKDWNNRVMASFNGTNAIPFTATGVGNLLSNGLTTSANAVNYFRGDRSLEVSTLRRRTGIMGAVLTAEAVVDSTTGVVYLASGEGAVHAFDKSTGQELWAYVPGFVLADMGDQLSRTWKFQTMLDATPQLAKVGDKRFLVGARGTAGAGVYALDVTKAKEITSDNELAAAVAWEFPNNNTPASTRRLVGALVGKPLVVNTPTGAVVVVASGYFPDTGGTGDGKARIFVLDATSGELKQTIEAPAQPGDTGEAGLSALSGFLEGDGTVRYVYGGDERGHLWRFDLQTNTAGLLMTLTDSSGTSLPITAAPELARINNRRMVFVGTGRFLGESDFNDSQRHSFFALWDNGTTIPNRSKLASRDITVGADGIRTVSGSSVDWTTQNGWVITLPPGEKAHTDPTMGSGIIVFTTNSPSITACAAASALYVAEASSGLALPDSAYPRGVTPWYGRNLGSALTSDPVLTRQSTGTMGITTRQSDGSRDTRTLNMGRAPAPRKTAWRELLR